MQLNPKATISDLLLIVAFLIILGYVGLCKHACGTLFLRSAHGFAWLSGACR
jgi:hypothetical protein